MKIKYYILSLVAYLSMTSCVEDKGSYVGTPVNEITISGLEDSYAIIVGETVLDIQPEVNGTLAGTDDSNYEYKWYVCKSDITATEHTHTYLTNTKNLNQTIDGLAPGAYTLYFNICDKSTDVEWQASASLSVETELMRGFYILGDKEDGTVGIDFLSLSTDTAVVKNIFTNSSSLKGAEDLIFSGYYYNKALQTLQLVTESGSHRISSFIQEGSVFDVDPTQKDEYYFFPTMDIQQPMKVVNMFPRQGTAGTSWCRSYRAILTEDACFLGAVTSGESYGNPMNRYSKYSETLFRPYKTAFFNFYTYFGTVLYDLDSEAFVGTNSYALSATHFVNMTDNPGDKFPWKNENRTIVYGENDAKSGYSYAVMKDKTDASKYYIYVFKVPNFSMNVSKIAGPEINTTVVTDFDKASNYTFYSNQSVVLYSVGSKLWGYNYATGAAPQMLKDFGSEITYLSMEPISTSSAIDFAIATYDSNNKGKIYKYTLNDNPNTIEIAPINNCEWSTDLKVVKLEYRYSSF